MNAHAPNSDGMHPADGVDWDTLWFVERDICFLYHELAEFPSINGDLSFSSIYNRAYWKCLAYPLPAMRVEEEIFLCTGCLMLVYTMCWDVLDGSGSYLLSYLDEVTEAVTAYTIRDITHYQKPERLGAAVKDALEAIRTNRPASAQMEQEAIWVNRTYVLGYFSSMAQALQNLHNFN